MVRRASSLFAAAITGGVVLAVLYAVVAIVVPHAIWVSQHPQYLDTPTFAVAAIVVAIILGALIGGAVGAITLAILALARPRHPVARGLALSVGPIAADILLYLYVFRPSPSALDIAILGCSVIVGAAGYIAIDRRLGRQVPT
jgi:hypothetical protein